MSDILTHLNPSQQEAVAHDQGPLLILAGAGSGKTRALTFRVAYLIKEKGIDPKNILLVTFTNKAANEMKARVKKLAGTVPPLTGTFHSFCAKILRHEGKHLGIPSNYLIYDESDQVETIKMAFEKLDLSAESFRPSSVLTTISQAKNELISATEYPQYAQGHFQKTVSRVYLAYQQLLKRFGALDFDDLLFETVRLFQKEKSVLGKYQNRFQHILVDEYQDTNRAQYLLTKLLAKRWRNLCVVGDASQAIYGWRGADYRNLINLKKDFPDLKVVNLEQNYRSTQKILDAAHTIISQNTTHPILKLWTKKKGGDQIRLYEAKSELDEAAFVVRTIAERRLTKREAYSDFAVLYRTNAQSRVLEEALLHASIPYLLVGGVRFYERKEIKDCLAYLRLLANPKDQVSFKRIEKLGKGRFKKFLAFLEKFNSQKSTTIKTLEKVLKTTGYLDLYDPGDEKDFARLENIKELRSVAMEFPSLTQFLENVALVEQEHLPEKPIKNEPKKAVTLMTTHAAKGLEFPVVFMVGMEEGLFPHSKSMMEKDKIEEERRLCYVGMTRAKNRLLMTFTRRRLYFGQRTSNPISRFIADIPKNLLE